MAEIITIRISHLSSYANNVIKFLIIAMALYLCYTITAIEAQGKPPVLTNKAISLDRGNYFP